jgi:hypothetical protein
MQTGETWMFRFIQIIIQTVKARASYLTRVWEALYLPVLVGTFSGWSFQMQLHALLVSFIVVVVYSTAQILERKFLR